MRAAKRAPQRALRIYSKVPNNGGARDPGPSRPATAVVHPEEEKMRRFAPTILALSALCSAAACFDSKTGQTTAAHVLSTVPADAQAAVPIDAAVVGTFSEPMDEKSINVTSFRIAKGTTPISGSVAYAGVIALFA